MFLGIVAGATFAVRSRASSKIKQTICVIFESADDPVCGVSDVLGDCGRRPSAVRSRASSKIEKDNLRSLRNLRMNPSAESIPVYQLNDAPGGNLADDCHPWC